MNELKVSLVLVVSRLTFRLAPTIPRNCATFVVSKNALYQGPPETNQPPLPPPRTRTIFAGSAMNYMYVRACAKRLRPPSSLRSILKADLATASEPRRVKTFVSSECVRRGMKRRKQKLFHEIFSRIFFEKRVKLFLADDAYRF